MATPHLFRTYRSQPGGPAGRLGVSRRRPEGLAHLLGMDTAGRRDSESGGHRRHLIEQVVSLTELCEHLHVSVQTIYDLRSQGRGPRGFRVGRELRFRASEIEVWLDRMEADDDQRHPVGGR
jgi:predicted DNA-binding transcriptional regulator AlpA